MLAPRPPGFRHARLRENRVTFVDGGADRVRGTVDLFERRRDLFEEENCAGGGKGGILLRDLLDLSGGFLDPLHRGVRARAEGAPAKARRERPVESRRSGHW